MVKAIKFLFHHEDTMELSQASHNKIRYLWYTLKITYGLFLLVVGIDKFFDIIVHWAQYVHPSLIPFVSLNTILLGAAIVEIVLGALILSPWVRVGAYVTLLWMAIVIVDLLALGLYDIAARDVLIALGILSLVVLTNVIEELS